MTETMPVSFKGLFDAALLATLIVLVLSQIVLRLRQSRMRPWLGISVLIFVYALCCGMGVFSIETSRITAETLEKIKHPSLPPLVTANWKTDLPAEERTRWSRGMAEWSYVLQGITLNYIELNGNLVPFKPSDQELERRKAEIRSEKNMEIQSMLFHWGGVGLLLLPLIGISLGLTFAGEQLDRFLIKNFVGHHKPSPVRPIVKYILAVPITLAIGYCIYCVYVATRITNP